MKRLLTVIVLMALTACGGIKQQQKGPTGTPTIKLDPKEITYQTKYGDTGTWNEQQITVTTVHTETGKETPAEAEVTVSWTSNNIKVFKGSTQINPGDKITTTSGSSLLTVQYFSMSKPNALEYQSNIIFQWQSATATLAVKVSKAPAANFALHVSPNKIDVTAKADQTEQWKTTAIKALLTADGNPISDSIFAFVSDPTYVKLIDTNSNYTTSGTWQTDSSGWATIPVTYMTKYELEYTTSVEIFYGSTSASIPINHTYEKPQAVTTTITPTTVTYTAPPQETGSWKTQFFVIQTKKASDSTPVSANVNVTASSQYVRLNINGQQTQTGKITTDSSGIANLQVEYYTQSKPSKVEYQAQVTANEAMATLDIKASDQPNTSYTINVAPSSFSYTYTGTDTGSWRTVWFTIVLADNSGNPVPNAEIDIVSPNTQYTKLYENNTEKTSPMTAITNANGKYFLRVDYYTQADYSQNPPVKTTYSGQLVISYNANIKTVNFEVK